MSLFKDIIRTKEQKSRYVWAKMATSVVCGLVAFHYASPYAKPFLGEWVGAVIVVGFFLAYITVAPIIAFIFCLLEGLAGL